MPRCVLDTSICLDLSNAGLLEVILRLPHEFLLPDVIAEELKEPSGQRLVELGYTPVSLSGEHIGRVTDFAERYRRPSRVDLFALAYARVHECILVTGDAALRTAAEAEGVDVHGVLWILDDLVAQNILPPAEAANALDRMIASGSWLPQEDCSERINRWRGGQ